MRHSHRLILGVVLGLGLLIGSVPNASQVLAADAPGSCASATTVSAQNVWISEYLASSTDQDWYRFSVATSQYVQVTLGSLPGNYRLELWSSCAAKSPSFSSDRSGTQYEEIYAKLAVGTWYARVRSASGAYSATVPYKLRFRPLSNRLQVLSSTSWITSNGGLTIVGELLNNTGIRYQYPKVYALLLNASGEVVEEDSGYWILDLPGPRQRSPFEVDVPKVPVGYAKYELVAVGETTTTAPVSGLVVAAGAPYTEYGWRDYPGSVRNSGAAVAQLVTVACTLYDNLGGVMNVAWTFTSPSSLMAGATGTFDCTFFDHWTGANRVAYVAEGS